MFSIGFTILDGVCPVCNKKLNKYEEQHTAKLKEPASGVSKIQMHTECAALFYLTMKKLQIANGQYGFSDEDDYEE